LSTYYKCTLSVITHKLNVSGLMLIWTFFSCFGMWDSYPEYVDTFQLHPVCKVHVRIYIRNGAARAHLIKPTDGVWVKAKKKICRGHELCSEGCETLRTV
jgi:hypothetical protein